ncbi:hypothetical protein LTR86_001587 [Recurvomyces mirabilis]|nr:hypothetical protein LTR86_001587 [Recurvomyces mirabilis]
MSPQSKNTRIENLTNRRVDLVVDEYEAAGRFNEQSSSPLFSVLPRELRDIIWEYATAPFEDQSQKFDENTYYYRPVHTARLKSHTALLLTCRRAWLEANAMPMLQAEHSFYYHREAPDRRDTAWTAGLTALNRRNFGHLHLFVQMFAIRSLNCDPGRLRKYFLETAPVEGDFQPRMLHVTLRHTDWYWWESDQPLDLHGSWVKHILNSPDLRSTHTFKLELETLDYKIDQLNAIIQRIKTFESDEKETHIVDGKPTTTKFVLVDRQDSYTWEGPTNINNGNFAPYDGKDKLKYHVITLTWKLTFPKIPTAFIPELRRARRIQEADITHPSLRISTLYIADTHRHWIPYMHGQRGRLYHQMRRGTVRQLPGWAIWGRMQNLAVEVLRISQKQDELAGEVRRLQFVDMKGASAREQYRQRWASEGSLLRLTDDPVE